MHASLGGVIREKIAAFCGGLSARRRLRTAQGRLRVGTFLAVLLPMDAERFEVLRAILVAREQSSSQRGLARALRHGPPDHRWIGDVLRAATRRARHRADWQLKVMRQLGLRWLPPWQWPSALARVQERAIGLFIRGERHALFREGAGVVGARNASAGAERWSEALAAWLCDSGLQVVSGGARGIDAAAHRGALWARGFNLSFIGVGCDAFYPRSQKQIFGRILDTGGAVLSEHPPGEGGRPYDHAARNRFIAALATTLYVAEAGTRSGSLITARRAIALGTPVFVSPPGVARLDGGLKVVRELGANELRAVGPPPSPLVARVREAWHRSDDGFSVSLPRPSLRAIEDSRSAAHGFCPAAGCPRRARILERESRAYRS